MRVFKELLGICGVFEQMELHESDKNQGRNLSYEGTLRKNKKFKFYPEAKYASDLVFQQRNRLVGNISKNKKTLQRKTSSL